MKIIKKDLTTENFDKSKIITAINKSADRVMVKLTVEQEEAVCKLVWDKIKDSESVDVSVIHKLVENALAEISPKVAESYRNYRNYKTDFVGMLDDVYKKAQSIMYIGDKDNANTDSALVPTRRSLIYNELNKSLYKKFFLTKDEIQATKDGYIYIHDMAARRDTMNCCLFNMNEVISGGFEMGNVWYNEPKTLDVAFDVISDITMSAAACQYGGFTIPRVDTLLAKYAEKSYHKYVEEIGDIIEKTGEFAHDYGYTIDELAKQKVRRDMEQGFQSWEYRFNTVGSSRGDYPFIAISFGLDTSDFGRMAAEVCLEVRKNGQGKAGFKKPVLFPKLTFLYDENLHGKGKELEYLFDAAVDCSAKSMYPDFLSLTGEGYVSSMYKQFGEVISPMGCRATLTPWYEKGGLQPADETDRPVFEGRCNLGAISLNLPMILAKSRQENKDFYEVLDYYMEMIRQLHKRTFEYLGEMKASTNPLAWCEGGFYGGHLKPNEKIKNALYPMTMTWGITALNESQVLWNGKRLTEDADKALEVMEHINAKIKEYRAEDGLNYASPYGTPELFAGAFTVM